MTVCLNIAQCMPSPVDGYLSSFQFSGILSYMFLCAHLQEFLCLNMELFSWYTHKLLDNDKLLYMVDPIYTTTSEGERGEATPLPTLLPIW